MAALGWLLNLDFAGGSGVAGLQGQAYKTYDALGIRQHLDPHEIVDRKLREDEHFGKGGKPRG